MRLFWNKNKDEHKYYEKVKVGLGKWRYFYSKEEYEAYLRNQRPQQNTVTSTVKDLAEKGKNLANNLWTSASNTATKAANPVKETASKATTAVKNATSSAVEKGRSFVESSKEKLSNVTTSSKEFKYFKKIGEGKNAKYFYSEQEYNNWLRKGQGLADNALMKEQTLNGVGDTLKTVGKEAAKILIEGLGVYTVKKLVNDPTGKAIAAVKDFFTPKPSEPYYPYRPNDPVDTPTKPSNPAPTPTKKEPPVDANKEALKNVKPADKTNPGDELNKFGKHPSESLVSSVEACNPKYDKYNPQYSENCFSCAMALNMRIEGYNTEALTKDEVVSACQTYTPANSTTLRAQMYCFDEKSLKNHPDNLIVSGNHFLVDTPTMLQSDMTNGAHINMAGNMKAAEQKLATQGDGAYGLVGFTWKNGGGHALNYYVKGGEVYILDSQVNTVRKLSEYEKRVVEFDFLRTDNLEYSDAMKEMAKKKG